MGDVINLQQARKRRAKQDRQDTARVNRLRHGRTKAEKAADTAEQTRLVTHLDHHRLDADPPSGEIQRDGAPDPVR